MKLTIVILIIAFAQVSAKSFGQLITLHEKNVSVDKVLSLIETQTPYHFVYYDNLDVLKSKTLNINVEKQTVANVLDQCFNGIPVSYKILKKTIVLKETEQPQIEKQAAIPQKIKGTVRDDKGTPLPGASIKVKGAANGTVTDSAGQFSIDVKPGDVLIISFVGFQTREIKIGTETSLEIKMTPGITSIDEMVVVGYGATRKNDLTGAVSTLKVSDISKAPVSRIDQALQGQIAGAQVIQNNGAPGSPISFFIRGAGTIGNTDPLFVIDGLPTKLNINTLNMADIESISVLKDASAAAVYGARAANGVVLINTKSGKKGKTTIDLDAYYGLQQAWKKLDLLDGTQWATARNTALQNDGLPADWSDVNSFGKGTDWQSAVLRTAPIQSYNLSASGGNDKTTYFISAGNFQQDGIIRYSNYERNSVRANIRSTPTSGLNFGSNFNFSLINSNVIPTEIAGVLKNAILAPPVIPVYRNGTFAGPTSAKEGSGGNPLAQAANANSKDNTARLTYNGFAEYEIIKNLKFKTSLGLDFIQQEQKTFNPTYAYDNYINSTSQLYQYDSNTLDWVWENTATYKTTIAKDHSITVLAGTSAEQSKQNYTNLSKTGFPGNDPNLQYLDNGSAVQASAVSGNTQEWSLLSYFGRVDYNFKDKYLFTGNVRIDGSSRFGPSNRYGTFPSFALGWNINKEDFMKDVDFINNLKLRASWGQLGNQDIGLYSFSSTLNPYYTTFGQTPTAAVGYAPGSPPNPAVKWETTTQKDIGLELSVLQSRLSFEIDYYQKTTDGMLLNLPTPPSSGYGSSSFTNAGSIKNTGIEFSTTYRKMTGDFHYSINANFSAFKNEVVSLGANNQPVINGLFFDFATISAVGHPMYQFYGYQMDGLFQNQADITNHATQPGARPGDVKFKDINNDGVINSKDRTYLGSPFPKFTYGLNANFSYKNFDCFIQLQGTQGNKIFNAASFWGQDVGETVNYSTAVLNSWHGEGTSNTIPILSTQDPNNNKRAVSRFIEDGSYMRVKNFQIGYTMPRKLMNSTKLRDLRLYVGVSNLFTFTKYTGFDPEVGQAFTSTSVASGLTPNGSAYSRASLGFDQVSFPQARTYTFGLQLGIL